MSSKANNFLKKALGEDFFQSLQKVELWKPGTRTTVDHEEIKTALHIVPRTLMALLIRELSPMAVGETKEIQLPFGQSAMVRINKHERDVYSGEVHDDNKMIVDFKYRSLPGIGLILLSAFELYDVDKKEEAAPKDLRDDATDKIQKMIDERLALHDLISKVVDHKLQQKEAVNALILRKLSEELSKEKAPEAPKAEIAMQKEEAKKKGSPLKDFLERKKPKEFVVHMAKGENVNCPDCKKNIFDGKLFSGCICLGDDRERKVFIKKTEDGIKVRFSKGWDEENIEMLVEVLRRKRG